eukprot:Tamp_22677.p3 GENE.Tamp_22677~~Tamp_22677.p3  ORF type:complete len:118 (-),score=7.89 Tamp_22677:333-686(-)
MRPPANGLAWAERQGGGGTAEADRNAGAEADRSSRAANRCPMPVCVCACVGYACSSFAQHRLWALGREREPRQDRSLERANLAQLAQSMQQPLLHPSRLHLSSRPRHVSPREDIRRY